MDDRLDTFLAMTQLIEHYIMVVRDSKSVPLSLHKQLVAVP